MLFNIKFKNILILILPLHPCVPTAVPPFLECQEDIPILTVLSDSMPKIPDIPVYKEALVSQLSWPKILSSAEDWQTSWDHRQMTALWQVTEAAVMKTARTTVSLGLKCTRLLFACHLTLSTLDFLFVNAIEKKKM